MLNIFVKEKYIFCYSSFFPFGGYGKGRGGRG